MNFLIRLGVPEVAVTEWKNHFVTAIFIYRLIYD